MLLVHVLFLQNFISTLTTYPALLWIAATWSLAVEEQFYLVAPLMVRYLSPKRLTYMLIGCIVAAPILRAILYNFSPAGKELYYVMMPCRADALAAGMFAALAWRSDTKFWLERHTVLLRQTLGVLVLGAVVMLKWLPGHIAHSTWQAAFQYSWMAALYVCLIMLALLEQNGVIARVARWKFLREWGRVSYCVYLVHLGVLGLCHLALRGGEPSLTSWSGFFTTLLALALTWGLAQSSWKFFEKPLLNRGHHYQYLRADPSIA
jgi:peptidoglycan/LPS O-acetylase OafA/YrhL